jgi:hypothetical protein
MTSDNGKDSISGKEIAFLVLLGIAGVSCIRWLVHNPDKTKQIDMAILLGTQKLSLAISDGFRKLGDGSRYVADKAGTQYNQIRSL